MRRYIFCYKLAICLIAVNATDGQSSDAIPAQPQKVPIALVGGMVHPVSSAAIENGTVVFTDGKITAVGDNVSIPDGAERVDISGKHVYPGLFNAGGQLGLVEINSTRATVDYSELGTLNPNLRVETAVNPDSELIPVTRSNGVLLTLSVPSGGLISGCSAVLQLDGWTSEDLTLKSKAGMHIRWPNVGAGGDKSKRQEPLQSLEDFISDSKAYLQAKQSNDQFPTDLKLEAMREVLDRTVPIIAHARRASEIQSAVAFAQRHRLRLIIYGGYEAEACASLLKRSRVPVVIDSVYRLPSRRDAPFDDAYTLPERLRKKGVQFCIAGVDRFGTSNLRNLAYNAATAAAYGLPEHTAIQAITLFPAEILGVADRVGSLDVGKDATLIITNGSPLETWSSVESAYVRGGLLDLNDRHKQLWQKYRLKYKRSR